MTDAEAASGVVDSVHFSFYTSEEIRKISVKKITKPNLLDAKNSPVPDGLYDPALGPLNDTDSDAKYSSLTQSRGESASEMDEESPLPKKVKEDKELSDLPPEFIKQMSSSGQKHLLPSEVELILNNLWKNEANLCMLVSGIHCKSLSITRGNKGSAMFFLKTLLVPPSKFRPAAGTSGRGVLEHPQNTLLSKVQQANIGLKNCIIADPDHPDILRRWMDLQKTVNVLFDSTKGFAKSDKEASGIRQLLEKKSGILRQKMMGKRVNFASRSVISPDPYLAVNEIGIPPYFALRLTYPERVTPWNVNKLRCTIINGANIHPGATHYKDKERMYKLQASQTMRNAISRKLPTSRGMTAQLGMGPESEFEGKVVYRRLQDGDIVLVNRQPTLHKPSMMAHVVRVLKGEKTLRMHYANCSTYNADFDGDEMNVHLPQDEISRAEAINIVNANKQYIVPTSGHPIRGLIQDHIVSAVLLTKMDTFLTREEYHQLLYASCVPPTSYSQRNGSGQKVSVSWSDYEIQPLPPAIWKPTPLWTGKQMHGFTCGVDDLLLSQKSDMEREKILEKSETQAEEVHMRFTRTKDGDGDPMKLQREIEKVLRGNGDSATALLDRMMSNSLNSLTSEINQALFPNGLSKPFLKNCLSLMTTTGAKGGLVNMTRISSLLGQQELEGNRVPRMNQNVVLQKFSDQIADTSLAKSNAYIRELPCSLRDKATDFVLKKQKSSPHQINQDFMKLMKLKYLSSLAEPGEAVGVVAAQSVGEPSTQMTLNTFHLAGKEDMNVTLGIPRLQEILMTASKDIRTPLMNCPLHAWKTKDDAERLAAKLRRVSVADVVERMEVCTVPFSIHGNQISTIYKLKMTLYPSELYPSFSELTLEDCREVLETTFVEAMEEAIAKHVDTIFKISDIKVVSGKEENDFKEGVDEDESRNKSSMVEENADGGDEDDESGDDQGTDSKRRKQQANDEVEYDDGIEKESFVAAGEHDEETRSGFESDIDHVEADEDYLMGGGSPGFDMDLATPESPSKADSTPISEDDKKKSKSVEKGKKETKSKAKKPKSSKKKIRRTIHVMAEGLKFEVHYISRSEPRILLAEIAQRTAKHVYVKEYKNIERCSLKENKKSTDPFMLQIAGVNFKTLWDLEKYLDINRYRPMNRVGMGDFNTSPFGKMTFETATKFIVESAFHGEVDTLESPSASVSLGQPVKMGTGCFDLMQNLQLKLMDRLITPSISQSMCCNTIANPPPNFDLSFL
ncbi:DNA-directed RNA polymerase [Musa troglodytarum]|uniref:DNA-directed RNA polymerase I subunit RPA1 n=1 Tax=Musa troglodytarum TaxID=320322 RepID=A0A9E7GL89_9LILI|nr:DNA-directed RNA polymerase [Musa troglodytarum]